MPLFNDRRDNNPSIDITQPRPPVNYGRGMTSAITGGVKNSKSQAVVPGPVALVKNAVSVVKQGTDFVHDLGYGIPFLGDAMRAEDAAKAAKKSKIASADQQRWINMGKKATESSTVKVKKAPITRINK